MIRLRRQGESWRLAQVPEVQGAFVALDPNDGRVQALAGGYDFFLNKYNHVTQARRQAGSGFKPFLYAAGLNAGYTAASVFLDAPVVWEGPVVEQVGSCELTVHVPDPSPELLAAAQRLLA